MKNCEGGDEKEDCEENSHKEENEEKSPGGQEAGQGIVPSERGDFHESSFITRI
jgi:hypothetical protein